MLNSIATPTRNTMEASEIWTPPYSRHQQHVSLYTKGTKWSKHKLNATQTKVQDKQSVPGNVDLDVRKQCSVHKHTQNSPNKGKHEWVHLLSLDMLVQGYQQFKVLGTSSNILLNISRDHSRIT